MLRRRPLLLVLALVAVTVIVWLGGAGLRRSTDDGARTPTRAEHGRAAKGRDLAEALARGRARSAKLPFTSASDDAGSVTIAGTVLDARSSDPVPDVEVVLRSAAGEETTTTDARGTFRLAVPRGAYRAFVRDDSVLSVGVNDRVRLPALPTVETVNAPDEALMPLVMASKDLDGVDLRVMRAGTLRGRVTDRTGRAVAGVVLAAKSDDMRPALGTDIVETDADGRFEMRLPDGNYALVAHHAKYAGIASEEVHRVEPGTTTEANLVLAAGCVVTGRVVAANGKPATDGALERQWGDGALQYAAAGRIEPDGSFRWVSTDAQPVTLRAWPWKSPPSPERRFDCKDGARFDNVVFQLPDEAPDIAGVLVDATGAPVPFTYVDLQPFDPDAIGQQERTDGEGKWAVYRMPPGRYRVQASAPGRGAVAIEIASPAQNVRLQLSGSGRLEGTTTMLANGSFEIQLHSCMVNGEAVEIAQERRLVAVTAGRFAIDDLPACQLELVASWRGGQQAIQSVAIPANGVATVELAIGPPRPKTVTGVVRSSDGQPQAHAVVHAMYSGKPDATAITDERGAYTIETYSGASLTATMPQASGWAEVGLANVDTEQVDLTLESYDAIDMEGEGDD